MDDLIVVSIFYTLSAFVESICSSESDGDVEIIETVKQQGCFMKRTLLDLSGQIDSLRLKAISIILR